MESQRFLNFKKKKSQISDLIRGLMSDEYSEKKLGYSEWIESVEKNVCLFFGPVDVYISTGVAYVDNCVVKNDNSHTKKILNYLPNISKKLLRYMYHNNMSPIQASAMINNLNCNVWKKLIQNCLNDNLSSDLLNSLETIEFNEKTLNMFFDSNTNWITLAKVIISKHKNHQAHLKTAKNKLREKKLKYYNKMKLYKQMQDMIHNEFSCSIDDIVWIDFNTISLNNFGDLQKIKEQIIFGYKNYFELAIN